MFEHLTDEPVDVCPLSQRDSARAKDFFHETEVGLNATELDDRHLNVDRFNRSHSRREEPGTGASNGVDLVLSGRNLQSAVGNLAHPTNIASVLTGNDFDMVAEVEKVVCHCAVVDPFFCAGRERRTIAEASQIRSRPWENPPR